MPLSPFWSVAADTVKWNSWKPLYKSILVGGSHLVWEVFTQNRRFAYLPSGHSHHFKCPNKPGAVALRKDCSKGSWPQSNNKKRSKSKNHLNINLWAEPRRNKANYLFLGLDFWLLE